MGKISILRSTSPLRFLRCKFLRLKLKLKYMQIFPILVMWVKVERSEVLHNTGWVLNKNERNDSVSLWAGEPAATCKSNFTKLQSIGGPLPGGCCKFRKVSLRWAKLTEIIWDVQQSQKSWYVGSCDYSQFSGLTDCNSGSFGANKVETQPLMWCESAQDTVDHLVSGCCGKRFICSGSLFCSLLLFHQ